MIISIRPTHIQTKKSNDTKNHYFFLLETAQDTHESPYIEAWELVYSQKDRYRLPKGLDSNQLKIPGEVKTLQKCIRENKNICIVFPDDETLCEMIVRRYIEDEILPLQEIARRAKRSNRTKSHLHTICDPIEWGDFVLLGR